MPLTTNQKRILSLLAAHRNPDRYVAGGSVLHKGDDSPRFSRDIDFFHDMAEAVSDSAEKDLRVLRQNGFRVRTIRQLPTFWQVEVADENETTILDWAHDTAYRFFPTEQDPILGYRLHPADAAVNKALAMAARCEPRDYLDMVYLHETYLPLGAVCWAACEKDPGYNPDSLLSMMDRHARLTPADLRQLDTASPLDPRRLKKTWQSAAESARSLFAMLPPDDLGCLYLRDGVPVMPSGPDDLLSLVRHRGSIRGAWPAVR